MADNVAVTEGAGKTIASDDVGGAQYQRIKIDLGGDGSASPLLAGQQAKAGSIPVTLASDEDTLTVDATSSGDVPITLDSEVVSVDATGQGDVPITTDGEIVLVDATGQGDVPVTLGGEKVIPAGSAAHDAAAADNPILLGSIYRLLAAGDMVDNDDAANILINSKGAIVKGDHPNAAVAFENHTSAQTNNALVAAPAANMRIRVTQVIVSSDGEAAGSIKLVEDTGGTPVDRSQTIYVPDSAGIVSVIFEPPLILTAAVNLGFTSVSLTNHSIHIGYYTEPTT